MIKRVLVALVLSGSLIIAMAGTAGAGEYNGKGKAVPGGVNGKSICSFSGLDAPDEVEMNPPGLDDDETLPRHVQSYGQLVSVGLKAFLPHPGHECRGNGGGGGG